MANDGSVHAVVNLVRDASQTPLLHEKLDALPLKGLTSLLSVAKALALDHPTKYSKQELVSRILLHHWRQTVLSGSNQDLVAAKLKGLPVKGPVSLQSLMLFCGGSGVSRMNKAAMMEWLLGEGKKVKPEEETISVPTVKEWLVAVRGAELDRRLMNCCPQVLRDACLEITGVAPNRRWCTDQLVKYLVSCQDDVCRGLPCVDRRLAESVAAVEAFRRAHGGEMPKRVHRGKGPAIEEDLVAQRWRRIVSRKAKGSGAGGLTATEVEYIEAVLGEGIWDLQSPKEDYIPGLPKF